jgi:UDP-N-acetylmuramoyl-tripeptide--D-alanyl-D-alanine ligase
MQRKFIQKILEHYVKCYFKKHPEVKLIAATGSIGKTSTKRAVATLLAEKYRVIFHAGNHNTHMSVPLSILDIKYPENYKKFRSWLPVFALARRRLKEPPQADIIIAELGTIEPGNIAHFGTYLTPYVSVTTAVTHEHMEAFRDIDTVAKEELGVANFSKEVFINRDDIDEKFDAVFTNKNVYTYGIESLANYRLRIESFHLSDGYTISLTVPEFKKSVTAKVKVVGEHSLRPIIGAVAIAAKLGLSPKEITNGLLKFQPTPGRMNLLKGVNDSIIIDDTYNANPLSANSALQTLYELQADQKIAILGSMNELGTASASEHKKLGLSCDPSQLAYVITIGDQAKKYLAPAARSKGCQVKSFKKSTEAGEFARTILKRHSAILVKGSQNNIYSEEAIKALCKQAEFTKLVRQDEKWLKTKEEFFKK